MSEPTTALRSTSDRHRGKGTERRIAPNGPGPYNAYEVAARLGRHHDWVYAHAAELGGVNIGDGWFFPRLSIDAICGDQR